MKINILLKQTIPRLSLFVMFDLFFGDNQCVSNGFIGADFDAGQRLLIYKFSFIRVKIDGFQAIGMVLPASGKRRLGNSSTEIQNALGPFTPCATDTIVICLSHLVVMGLCMYRIWITQKNSKAQKYCLRSCYYNYFLACLAGCSAAEPLFRLIMDGLAGLAPYEVRLSFKGLEMV